MIYRAAAALPHADRRSATDTLRGQLRIMAVAGRVTPDWTTFDLAGPVECPGELCTRFEWTACVAVEGTVARDLLAEPDAVPTSGGSAESTMPFPRCVGPGETTRAA